MPRSLPCASHGFEPMTDSVRRAGLQRPLSPAAYPWLPPDLALSGTSPRERYPSIWSSVPNSESDAFIQGFDLPHPSKSWGTPARGGCLVILLHASAGHAGPKPKLDHRRQISLAPKLAAITSGRYEHLGRSDNDRDGVR
jgi:hypothetical protein